MVDEVITKQGLIDAQKDAQSLDEFINGEDEQIVVTRLLKEYPTLANAIRQIYEKGGKFYPALADANADIANIRTDVYVITGDNGAYYKATAEATTLTKSPYDPVEQAKADATAKANAAEVNAKNYADNTKTSKDIANNNTGTSQIAVIADAEGNIILNIDQSGGVYLAGESESVQDQLKVNERIYNNENYSLYSQSQDITGVTTSFQTLDGSEFIPNLKFSIQDEFARLKSVNRVQSTILGMSNDARVLAGEAMHFADSQSDELSNLSFLAPYTETNTIQRISSILKVNSNTLLFVWGGAVAGYNGDSQGVKLYKKLVKINRDYTLTELENRVLIASPALDSGVSKHPMLGKTDTGRIILAYDERDNTAETYRQYVRFSDDGGATFTPPVQIPHHPDLSGVVIALGSTGQILTTSSGRLLIPYYAVGNICWICYSDDHGATWTHGNLLTDAGAEPTISFDSNGDILMSIRRDGSGFNKKLIAKSVDNGVNLSIVGFNDYLTSNPCASSLFYDDDFKVVLHGTPKLSTTSSTRRFKYQIQFSFDDGITFPIAFQPFDDEYYIGYSEIIKLEKGVYAVAVEGLTYAVGTNSKESSGIYIFNLKEAFQKCR